MCEYKNRFYQVKNRMAGKAVEDFIPEYVMVHIPLDQIQPGHCPKCGRGLSPIEMRPPGRTTRSLCPGCYGQYQADSPVRSCIICGQPLPDNKMYSQQSNNREIAHYMHDGLCRDYFTIIHATVVGEAFPFRAQQLPSPDRDLIFEVERLRRETIEAIQQSMETLAPIMERLPQSNQGLNPLLPGSRAHAIPWSAGRDAADDTDLTIIDLPPTHIKPESKM